MVTNKTFDVAVVGAGVFGSWIAYQLQQDGAEVILVDAYGPGNNRSSSGGESRIIRMGYGPDEIYTRSALRSLALWQQFFETIECPPGAPLFHKTGVLWLAKPDDAYCAATLSILKGLGVPIEELGLSQLQRRYPQLEFDGVTSGILEPESGVLMARRAVSAVVGQASKRGVVVWTKSVQSPTGQGKLPSLITIDGLKISAENFVFACGPWLPKLFPKLLGGLIHVTRQEVFFFGPSPGDDRFALNSFPAWIDFNDLAYGIPNLESRGFKIAIDAHGSEFDPDTGDRLVANEGLMAVREYLRKKIPMLAEAPVLETRVCQYENTSNGDFLIDRHPGFDNVWLVGGGSGHGFKHGPAVAEYVTRMLKNDLECEPRFKLSTKQTVQQRQVY